MEQTPAQMNFGNYPLRDITTPHPHDVLCGRGGGTNNHVGNSHWRMLVAANKQLYVTLPKRQKMLLSRSIVNAVRSQNPPGRFLQKDAKTELWYDVGDQRAQEKTSQALREGAPDIRKGVSPGEAGSTEDSTSINTGATIKNAMPTPSIVNIIPPGLAPSQQHTVPGLSTMPSGVNASFAPVPGAPVPPPGSTPVMVYAMPQGGVPGMPLYQAMVTPEGLMVPGIHGMPPIPPPVLPQGPNSIDSSRETSTTNPSMPPPSKVTHPYTASSLAEISHSHPAQLNTSQSAPLSSEAALNENNALLDRRSAQMTDYEQEAAALMNAALEPSGISFGSVSMASVGKLEPAGTSFGSMMSFTMASRAPDMVDGGLEPIGTSFGSLSLSSVDRSHLQRALQQDTGDLRNESDAFATPTLLSQQRSTGNLLECSDTESDDEDEEATPNQASKSAEWEKLKAMLEAHTNMEAAKSATPAAGPPPAHDSLEAIPHTGFDRDFSNISAISMGEFEDFDNLATVYENGKEAQSYAMRDVLPSYPPMRSKSDQENDDDSISERERLELLYLAHPGGHADYARGNA